MSATIHCPACDGACAIYGGHDVQPGAVPQRELADEETRCQNCRRRIHECLEMGECGREESS